MKSINTPYFTILSKIIFPPNVKKKKKKKIIYLFNKNIL